LGFERPPLLRLERGPLTDYSETEENKQSNGEAISEEKNKALVLRGVDALTFNKRGLRNGGGAFLVTAIHQHSAHIAPGP